MFNFTNEFESSKFSSLVQFSNSYSSHVYVRIFSINLCTNGFIPLVFQDFIQGRSMGTHSM